MLNSSLGIIHFSNENESKAEPLPALPPLSLTYRELKYDNKGQWTNQENANPDIDRLAEGYPDYYPKMQLTEDAIEFKKVIVVCDSTLVRRTLDDFLDIYYFLRNLMQEHKIWVYTTEKICKPATNAYELMSLMHDSKYDQADIILEKLDKPAKTVFIANYFDLEWLVKNLKVYHIDLSLFDDEQELQNTIRLLDPATPLELIGDNDSDISNTKKKEVLQGYFRSILWESASSENETKHIYTELKSNKQYFIKSVETTHLHINDQENLQNFSKPILTELYETVTDLTLGEEYDKKWFNVLPNFKKLVNLTLHLTVDKLVLLVLKDMQFDFPVLRNLKITLSDDCSMNIYHLIWPFKNCTALKQINFEGNLSFNPHTDKTTSLQPLFNQLRELTISLENEIEEDEFLSWLKRYPYLETFTLEISSAQKFNFIPPDYFISFPYLVYLSLKNDNISSDGHCRNLFPNLVLPQLLCILDLSDIDPNADLRMMVELKQAFLRRINSYWTWDSKSLKPGMEDNITKQEDHNTFLFLRNLTLRSPQLTVLDLSIIVCAAKLFGFSEVRNWMKALKSLVHPSQKTIEKALTEAEIKWHLLGDEKDNENEEAEADENDEDNEYKAEDKTENNEEIDEAIEENDDVFSSYKEDFRINMSTELLEDPITTYERILPKKDIKGDSVTARDVHLDHYYDVGWDENEIILPESERFQPAPDAVPDLFKAKKVFSLREIYETKYAQNPNVFYFEYDEYLTSDKWVMLAKLPNSDILSEEKEVYIEFDKDIFCAEDVIKNKHLRLSAPGRENPERVTIACIVQVNPAPVFQPWSGTAIAVPKLKLHTHENGTEEIVADIELNEAIKNNPNQIISLLLHWAEQMLNHFSPKSLPNPDVEGLGFLNACIENKTGACDKRAIICFYYIKNLLPVHIGRPILYKSDGHLGVGILTVDQQFIHLEHGGYPANLHPIKTIKDYQTPDVEMTASPLPTAKPLPEFKNFAEFYQYSINQLNNFPHDQRNLLVFVQTEEQLAEFKKTLFKHLQALKQNYYRVSNLDEICFETQSYSETGMPYGKMLLTELGDFLEQVSQSKAPSILLIDWSKRQPRHIGHNSVVEPGRRLKHKNLPDNIIVISVALENQIFDLNVDFLSRHPVRMDYPTHLNVVIEEKEEKSLIPSDSGEKINLYGLPQWKTILGRVVPGNDSIRVDYGSLMRRLKPDSNEKRSLEIINPPESLKEIAWEALQRNYFYFNGYGRFPITEQFKKNVYFNPVSFLSDFKTYKDTAQFQTLDKHNDLQWQEVLNPVTYDSFFQVSQLDKNQLLVANAPGLLEKYSGQIVTLLLTAPISDPFLWDKLLARAKEFYVGLMILVPPHLRLETFLEPLRKETEKKIAPSIISIFNLQTLPKQNLVIYSDALLETAASIQSSTTVDLCIPVNETDTYWTIMEMWSSINNKPEDRFKFKHIKGDVLQTLEAGKTVVMVGDFSMELVFKLEKYFSKKNPLPGRLIIITSNREQFKWLPVVFSHALPAVAEEKSAQQDKVPISLHNLNNLVYKQRSIFIAEVKERRDQHRIQQLLLAKKHRIFHGHQIQEWADSNSKQGELLVLFIAYVAILKDAQLMNFLGFYLSTPNMLVKNGRYPILSSDHKIIFTNRDLPLQKHFIFKHCFQAQWQPPRYQEILSSELAPLLITITTHSLDEIPTLLTRLGEYLTQTSVDPVAVLWRYAALKNNSYLKEASDALLRFAFLDEVQCITFNKSKSPFKDEWQNESNTRIRHQLVQSYLHSLRDEKFVITPSRYEPIRHLGDMVAMRALKMKYAPKLTGNLALVDNRCGFLWLGPSGVGKSTLAVKFLQAFKCSYVQMTPTDPDEVFNQMQITTQDPKQPMILLDEYNTIPITPLVINIIVQLTKLAGWGFIFTGNLAQLFHGREVDTPELRDLFYQPDYIPDYPQEELITILQKKGLNEIEAKAAVTEFENGKTLPLRLRKTARDIFRIADNQQRYKFSQLPQLFLPPLPDRDEHLFVPLPDDDDEKFNGSVFKSPNLN